MPKEVPLTTKTPENILQALRYILSKYEFTTENYPKLKKSITPKDKKIFAINHSLMHMNKATGKIAGELEKNDHGGDIDFSALQEATVKMFINVLVLANEIGIDGKRLCKFVPKYMKSEG